MTFHIPQGCSLTIEGPQFVTIGLPSHYAVQQGYAPVPTPTPTPVATPQMVPQATPQAVPQAHPVITVPGFQPTYASWGGYAPVELGEGKVSKEKLDEIAAAVEETKTKLKQAPGGDVESAFSKLTSMLAEGVEQLKSQTEKLKAK